MSTHDPPCKQLLAEAEVGAGFVPPTSCPCLLFVRVIIAINLTVVVGVWILIVVVSFLEGSLGRLSGDNGGFTVPGALPSR